MLPHEALHYLIIEIGRLAESEVGRIGLRKVRSIAVAPGRYNSVVVFDGPFLTRPVRTSLVRRAVCIFHDFALIDWECVVTGTNLWCTGEDHPILRPFYTGPDTSFPTPLEAF